MWRKRRKRDAHKRGVARYRGEPSLNQESDTTQAYMCIYTFIYMCVCI